MQGKHLPSAALTTAPSDETHSFIKIASHPWLSPKRLPYSRLPRF
jgi:hypothetical protein